MNYHAAFLLALFHCCLATVKELPPSGVSVVVVKSLGQNQSSDSNDIDSDITYGNEVPYKTVCYDEIGCFDNSIGNRLPANPDLILPQYLLISDDENIEDVTLKWNDTVEDLRVRTRHFFDAREKPLIFIAHGFGESIESKWVWNLKTAALGAYPNANVVLINWRFGASLPLYNRAAANVPVIANMTVRLTRNLMGISPSIKAKNIYIIGFSLGAQLAGFYARTFAKHTGTKIGRITSLDAASPTFVELGIAPRRGDADFVEAIHTSGGNNLIQGKFGYLLPYADIDFYPNGGVAQPGCGVLNVPCSHKRAPLYLIDALGNLAGCQFRGVRCTTVKEANTARCTGPAVDVYIGQKNVAELHRRDDEYLIVYLKTSARRPFCLIRK